MTGEEPRSRSLDAVMQLVIDRIDSGLKHINDRMDEGRIQEAEFHAKVLLNQETTQAEISGLSLRVKEQNGNFANLLKRVNRLEEERALSDKETASHFKVFDDAKDANAIRKGVYAAQWKMLSSGVGIGASAIAALLYVLGML